ncbi:hypothetical protein BHM03_00028061 [Ensete ventricosum]|nr:hypothetical protein BHM03_00028061 [Ensete ventricosum]
MVRVLKSPYDLSHVFVCVLQYFLSWQQPSGRISGTIGQSLEKAEGTSVGAHPRGLFSQAAGRVTLWSLMRVTTAEQAGYFLAAAALPVPKGCSNPLQIPGLHPSPDPQLSEDHPGTNLFFEAWSTSLLV